MGYYGSKYYGKLTMREVRKRIEEETGLTVKSLNYWYAVCVCDNKVLERSGHWRNQPGIKNFIVIALWRKSDGFVMIKQVSEDMGPCEVGIPLKYVNAICEATKDTKFAVEWRQRVRDFHSKRKQNLRLARTLIVGDHFFVYGDLMKYLYPATKGKDCIIASQVSNGKQYRVKPIQVSMV